MERAKILLDKGALAAKDLEVAQDTEDKAKVDVETAQEHLRVLGADADNPSPIVDITAPVSGVITDQQVTTAAGRKPRIAQPLHDFRSLARLGHVRRYENDLPFVHVGEFADINLNAYPGRTLRGRIGNIGPTLDPNIRTAKVRLEIDNPAVR